MRHRVSLFHDKAGSAAMEFALVSPILIFLLIGSVQLASLLFTTAGVRQGIGEAARFARVYKPPAVNASWAGPTPAQICTRFKSALIGTRNATIEKMTLETGSRSSANLLTLTIVYKVPVNFIFFSVAPTLTQTRTVFVQSKPDAGLFPATC